MSADLPSTAASSTVIPTVLLPLQHLRQLHTFSQTRPGQTQEASAAEEEDGNLRSAAALGLAPVLVPTAGAVVQQLLLYNAVWHCRLALHLQLQLSQEHHTTTQTGLICRGGCMLMLQAGCCCSCIWRTGADLASSSRLSPGHGSALEGGCGGRALRGTWV